METVPSDAAVRNRHHKVVDLLLSNGASLKVSNNLASASMLGRARLGCPNDEDKSILRLLKSYSACADAGVRNNPPPAGYRAVLFDARKAWCDACTIIIPADTVCYSCNWCHPDGLCICLVR